MSVTPTASPSLPVPDPARRGERTSGPDPARTASRWARWLPGLSALAAIVVGLVNLISALTPNLSWRGHVLLDVEGVDAIPIFHALAVPAGAALCLASLYLARRRWRAWQAAVALLLVLGLLDLLKGLDFEEAFVSWGVAALLFAGRAAFSVRHERLTVRSGAWRILLLGLLASALTAVVFWAYAPRLGLGTALRETGDLLLWQPGPTPLHGIFAWLPLGIGMISAATVACFAYLVFRPLAVPQGRPEAADRRLAQDLVRAHGADTLSFFKLREDKQYLFGAGGDALLGYRIESGTLLVSGDPVGPAEALPALVRDVVSFAQARGLGLGVLGASADALPLWESVGLRGFYLGDEAVVDVARFSLEGRQIRKVRQSVTRLTKAGYTAELLRLSRLDEGGLCELETVLERGREGAPERGFSMAMDSLRGEHLADSVVILARDDERRVRGVLHFVPCYRRPAMSLSFMRRDPDTPNGLTEFLVARGIGLLAERGVEEVSLNFAAFARWIHSPQRMHERVLGKVVALANPFFQIESLYRFNAKFFPRWEPRYLVCRGKLGFPRVGLAAMWVEGQLPKPRVRRRGAA
ncbi:MAG: lysyl-tRNA synthetase, class [Solirubrobacteraceae bacterium]|jgi:lysyl-tRNA synthetase class 2|nr:lysyl-tRNA synthetase, class [Solirubrobacteraceae bacterium]